MKKIIIFLITILLVGCTIMNNTPTMAVSSFFQKYQNLDKDILKELDSMIERESEMTKSQKKKYKVLLEKQYQNLSYKIKDEKTNKNQSIVEVEIEVLNYQNAKVRAKQKAIENEKEDFIDFQIKEMEQVIDKMKYDITFFLENEDGLWKIKNISEEDIKKIHGIFEYY